MSTLLGTILSGRYRLEARIGAGGMSTVYRATDETLQRQVAIKLMNREIASDSDQLERFRREARAVAQLSHPHIVGVIDYGEDDGRPYIVFEYVEGETLKERIRRTGRLPTTEAVAYAIEIARALGVAHARHIVHRDVKPQNVLIDEEGSAKVTDFGIARTLDEEGLTADGRVLGTTDYVSPEQALGRPVTGQSDLYSLGIVLYEMLTGEVPFKGENQVAVAMKHVREELPDVQAKRPEVSSALAAIVDTATAKRVEDRYADDAELIADLEDVLAIETARAGSATGEVTSVLRTLPSQTAPPRPVPGPPPGPRRAARAGPAGARRRRGSRGSRRGRTTGPRSSPPPAPGPPSRAGGPVRALRARLQPGCAQRAQDPEPASRRAGDRRQPQHVLADRALLLREARQARRRPVRRRAQARPGAQARDLHPDARVERADLGEQLTPRPRRVHHRAGRVGPAGPGRLRRRRTQKIALNAPKTGYRYYLVWITGLPPGKMIATSTRSPCTRSPDRPAGCDATAGTPASRSRRSRARTYARAGRSRPSASAAAAARTRRA